MTLTGLEPGVMYHFAGQLITTSQAGEYDTDDAKLIEAIKAAGYQAKRGAKTKSDE